VAEPVRASAAQVEAVEKAWWNGSFNRYGAPRRVTFRAIADAVVAAGPDVEVLRVQLEHAEADRDALRAEVLRLRTDKATFEQWRDSWVIDMDARLAELAREEDRADRLAATVERVRAVAKRWGGNGTTLGMEITKAIASTPETPHAPAGRDESASGQSGEAGTLGGAEKRCTTCGRGLDTPPCCKTPDGISGHTGGGGRESAEADR
jgi:hypothetical protein